MDQYRAAYQSHERRHQFGFGGGFCRMWSTLALSANIRKTTVDHERHAAFLELRTEPRAIAVAQGMIQDGTRSGAGIFQRLSSKIDR